MSEENQQPMGFRFLGVVTLGYIIIAMMQTSKALHAFSISINLLAKIFPVLGIVFVMMLFLNLFLSPEAIVRYIGRSSGLKRWGIAIVAGIISTGPIYLWYALLKELVQKGMSKGVVAAFLYARAIKPFLLPLMIYYFGWKYAVVLTVVMIFVSILQGVLVERIMEE